MMTRSFQILFKKRLSISLFVILPAIGALIAFSSGFVALALVDNFMAQNGEFISTEVLFQARAVLRYVKLEVLGFTLLGLAAGFGIAYAILHPLRRLMAGARQAALGDFTAGLKVESLDELGGLGKDFNLIVSSLNKYFVDYLTGGWIFIDKTGKLVSINPIALAILGCGAEDVVGRRYDELFRHLPQVEEFKALIAEAFENQTAHANRETRLVAKDGRKIRVSLSTSVLKNASDVFAGVAATIKDLTRAEEIVDRMEKADRLAAVGTLAAGLAHEIRNPLGAIRGLAQLLREKLPGDATTRAYTQTMVKEIDRLNGVVSSLLNYAQPTAREAQPCDVNNLLDQALNLALLDAGSKGIKLTKNYAPSLPPIWADGRKLIQAFLNILINAHQAIAKLQEPVPGRLEIRVATRFDPELFRGSAKGEPGGIVVEIADTGLEVNPDIADRIFDPFVTDKQQGTGLGLAITRQIVAMHQGTIAFARRDGFTVFTLVFPLAELAKPTPETVGSDRE
ncbi:MAG: PAS domain S-box protein [Nitrospinae bacterium]|nr:PAS domain S-box protein [Nitrospinota bacterium]